ncbi:MAG: hypothetical protein ACR2LM_15220 [Pyrinomonadaceae bacterium]
MQLNQGEPGFSLRRFEEDATRQALPSRRPLDAAKLVTHFIILAICLSPGKVSADSQNSGFANTLMSSNIMAAPFDKKAAKPAPFYEALRKALKKRKTTIDKICPVSDPVARRILEEYGAIFLAVKKVLPPPTCVFTAEEQVTAFHDAAGFEAETIADAEIELQPEAMESLRKAREEAEKEELDITPRGGAEAARRNYDDSMRLWDTRFLPALDYWLAQGRLTADRVTRLRGLSLHDQVAEVLELEKSGIFFSKDLSKSILYSIAAPGTSQHIAMLALDVTEFDNPRVREILAKHGWFQTVLSDLPHFTFLGLKEKDLPKNGLKSVVVDGQTFWIPNVG